MMAAIAVTGASGLVARHLIPELLREGHTVRGLSRSAPQNTSGGTADGFQLIAGDVRDGEAVRRVLNGAASVIHLAASFSPDDQIADIVLRGTAQVLAVCHETTIKRLVYLSCLGADAGAHSAFLQAKWKAETLIRGSDVPHTILRASTILGRGSLRPLADMARSAPAIPVPGDGRGRVQPIDVADVVRCLASALGDDNLEGEVVPVGGPMYLTFRQLVDLVAGEVGAVKPKLLVPWRLIPAVTSFLPAPARRLYAEPRTALFRAGVVASPGIIERNFGFQASSVLPGMAGYIA